MDIVFEGVHITVYKDGAIQIKNNTVEMHYDVDGFLKVCINNRFYKLQNIIAMVFLNYDMADKGRYVTHIDKNPRNNNINNLRIEHMGLKRKLENVSLD
jgi:ABC-type histidine transport system ATPase subunit